MKPLHRSLAYVAVMTVAVIVGGSACSPASANTADKTDVTVKTAQVNGRSVPCVVIAKQDAVAVSCDWSAK